MKQQKIAYLLKGFTILSMVLTALFCFWLIPIAKDTAIAEYPELESLRTLGSICTFILFLLCLHALFHFYKICQHIALGNSFCQKNAQHMKMITITAISLFIFFIICFVILYVNSFVSGPLLLWGTLLEFIVSGIAVLCYALTKLIENACAIQEENDLTI